MKKALIAALLSTFTLTACSTGSDMIVPDEVMQQDVNALASSTKTIKMNKEDTKTVKKVESKLDNKAQNNVAKDSKEIKITYKDVSAKNYGEQGVAAIANFALKSMDSARTWESAAQIGYRALEDLGRQDVYVANLSYRCAKASSTWEEATKMMMMGLSNIANQVPNSADNSVDLVLRMMDTAKTWDSGSKVGYAALEFIGSTDNMDIRNLLATVYRAAKAARTWEDSYKTIAEGLRTLKTVI